jgi:drug/metabolite transporter (DMT)-like permease
LHAVLALVAFATNSVLCRLALRDGAIDAASFSTIRLISGAATLLLLTSRLKPAPTTAAPTTEAATTAHGSWISAALLFLYAVPFSFAYLGLSAGTGALILFGGVQLTMMIAAIRSGERPQPLQWLGIGLACAGLVYLVLPGLSAPPLASAALMALAGCAWGFYSLRGRGATDPLAQTTGNFVRSVPMVVAVSVLALPQLRIERSGVLLAVASGAVTSALGYVVWYAALRTLTATRAAVVQLAVPILAAVGGVVLLAEMVSLRLVLSTVMVVGGIALQRKFEKR